MSDKTISKRKKLDKIINLIDTYNQEIDSKVNELANIENQKNELIAEIINDEKLLKNSQWELNVSGATQLKYSGKIDDVIMSHIINLFKQASFIWIDLEQGIQFQADEDEIRITFDQPKTILPFVKKHQMNVSGASVKDKIQSLKREASALENLCHVFSLKD